MPVTAIKQLPTVNEGQSVQFTYSETPDKCHIVASLINAEGKQTPIEPENMPREFAIIKSSVQFHTLLKDAYVKASCMSDGNYRLYLNQRIRGGGGDDTIVDVSSEADLPSKTMALVRKGVEEIAGRHIEKNAVLLVGRTGAGKSMVGNLLSDVPLEGIQVGLDFRFDATDPIFPISHSNVESCTGCPIVHTPKKKDYTYIDYPGFDDTHGAPQDITNAFFRKEVLRNVERLKIVLVVGYHDISKRGVNLSETFTDLIKFLGITEPLSSEKLEKLTKSITLIVSHVPPLENSMVITEIGDFLENYLLDDSSLSSLGKEILGQIIEKKKWSVFSSPTKLGTSPKVQPEKMKLLKLIHEGADFISKSDVDIQVKVSDKYSGMLQTSLQYLISNLKKEFADRIFEEIATVLKNFVTGVAEEKSVVKFQKKYQKLIDSKEPCTLGELLKDLKLTPEIFEEGLLDEVQDRDEKIKFLRDLLDPKEAEKIPHRRDWLKEFDLRDRLLTLNGFLLEMTAKAELIPEKGKLVLQGYFPKTSQITSVLNNYADLEEIEIHAFHTVTIDENLSGPKLRGVNVTIIAPKWIIREDRRIELTGKDCDHTYGSRNTDGETEGASGTDGQPGLAGKNGGHFLGVGIAFSGNQRLTVVASGGKGGPGQNGGNGYVGADGAHAVDKRDFCKTQEGAKNHGTVIAQGWDHVEFPPFDHGNGTFDMRLTNYGKEGERGGNAGKGGAGGNGGLSGTITFVSVADPKIAIQQESKTGDTGANGTSGAGGLGGKRGMDWTGIWHLGGNPDCGWNGWEPPHYRGGGKRAPKGSVFADEKNDTRRAAPDALSSFDTIDHLYRYREFTIEKGNPLIEEAVEIFREAYDKSPEISKKATIESFIAECQKMEDFFTKSENKAKSLPMYIWMVERIQSFDSASSTPGQVSLLQCLYTLTLSKILQIQAMQESRLIIDIKGFLKNVEKNVDALNKLDHAVLIGIYEKEYVEEINSKIAEADTFIGKLSDDIRAADQEIKTQVEKLLEEINTLQKKGAEKKGEIEAKRKELQDLLSKRKLLGALTVAVQCIGCCFPPAGPIIAGVVSAGLTVAANSGTAPVLAAETLATYTEGMAGALTDAQGNPLPINSLHQMALSRVRTTTLINGALNAVGATGGSEQEQLKAMDKAIKDLDEERKQLEEFKGKVKGDFGKSLHQIVDGAAAMQTTLKNKSKIALDFSRLAMKRAFDDIKNQIGTITKPFATGEGFLNIIRQLEEAVNTTAKIYDQIQEYEEKRRLVNYLARLAAPSAQNPQIEIYKQKVQRNVVLEQYSRAVAAVRQWAFPFASLFLGDFANLKQFTEKVTIDEFMAHVKLQIRLLQAKVSGKYTEINAAIDTFLWTGNFASGQPNGPFYIWNYAEHGREIRDLLRGEAVPLFANVDRTSNRMSAIKCTHIELQITSKKPTLKRLLSTALNGVHIEMKHSGLSYYKYDDKVYEMANDKGFSLGYRFKGQGETPEDSNEVFTKMKEGNFMLSPYTQWTVALDIPPDFIKQFEEQLAGIEVHLIGRGQFIYTGKAKGKNLKADEYKANVFMGANQSIPGAAASSSSRPTESRDDNALRHKDNRNYLYQATDINYIVKSPQISRELANFHFIQGLQVDHLRRKIDEIAALLDEGKPVLCVYNISNIHWVTFCMLKKADGNLVTLYKDSVGSSNIELISLLKEKSAEFKPHPGAEQVGDGTSCGIFALENMRIMARELNENRERFVANFTSHTFCSLARANELRRGDFATFYTEGVQEFARQEGEQVQRAQNLRQAHQGEIDTIITQLQAGVSGEIKVQTTDIEPNSRRTIAIQIGAEGTNFANYHYRIQGSRDISLQELQNILMQSHFAWYEGADYRIEGNAIKVSTKIV